MIKIDRHSPKPLFLQVKEKLRLEITSGRLSAHEVIPDERTLAKELGISRVTVRRAILELAQEGMLERIRGRGTFVLPTGPAGDPATAARTTFAVVAPFGRSEVKNSLFYHRILLGIHDAAGETGAAIVFRKLRKPYGEFVRKLGAEGGLAGLIVLGIVDQELLQAVAGLEGPVVLVDSAQPEGGPLIDQVGVISDEGAYDAVSALIELGHRRIALFNFEPLTQAARGRRAGYERALADHAIEADPGLYISAPLTADEGYDAMARALEAGLDATAVFCAADEFAVAAMTAARESGLRVPRDISIVGFGDAGHFTSPTLSTVRMPVEEMGLRAVDVLRRRIERPGSPPERVLLASQWVPRGTTAAPPGPSDQASSSKGE